MACEKCLEMRRKALELLRLQRKPVTSNTGSRVMPGRANTWSSKMQQWNKKDK